MKIRTNLLLTSAVALTSVGFVFSTASAQGVVSTRTEKTVETQNTKGGNPNAVQTTVADPAVVTTAAVATDTQNSEDKTKKEKSKGNAGKVTGEEHRSMVATFVKSLLAVADREGGIGQEIKVIALQQNDSKDRASDLINAVENRSKMKTFFIGTSYKNLGELRSQMVTTRNQIEQLKRLSDKAENPQDKTELQTQIQALEQQQKGITDFIAQNESKFSLFGWAVKLFNK